MRKTTKKVIYNKKKEDYDVEFIEKIEQKERQLSSEEKLHINSLGIVVLVDKASKQLKPLGCPYCFDLELGQDELGYPTIGGKPLLSSYDIQDFPAHIENIIRVNLWFCPQCRKPIKELLPILV